ncbi:MAG TPA: MFS transporter [Xanthobacteraceae bacterium]|nr:MFS transporter [Xanthobacteraceae bacterium]
MSATSAADRSSANLFEQENLLARLDRMPVNGKILFLVGLLGIVWILEAFDIGIIAPVLFILKGEWHLSPSDTGLIGSAGTLGIVLGLLPAGRLADRFGRKSTLVAGIVIFSVVTFIAAFSQNVTQLVLCRFVAGLGQGAVFPVPYLLLSEFVNKQWRGTAVGLANSLLGFSYGLNTLAGALIIGRLPGSEAWWVLLMIGGLPIVIVPVIMAFLPESPRFLLKAGRAGAVRAFVEDLENISGVPHDDKLIDQGSLKVLEATAQRKVSIFDLFRYPYLGRCVVSYLALMSPFVVFYVITIYGPSILQRMGAGKEDALYYTSGLLFWTVISTAIAGAIGDKISRRWGLVVIMTITALATVALGAPLPRAGVIAAAIVTWGFVYAGFPLAKLYMAEQFPTRLRGTGVMLGESVTRFLGGVVLVYLFPILSAIMPLSSLFLLLAVLTVVCILPIWLMGVQTSGVSVEETGTDLKALAKMQS